MIRPQAHARAFSLIELLLVILVIFMLMGLLLGGFRYARSYAKRVADRTSVKSLQQAVSYFDQKMGFLPPLVKDMGDPPGWGGDPTRPFNGENRPNVYTSSAVNDLAFLRTDPAASAPDMRFSIYSYPYYLLGACEVPRLVNPSGALKPMDGIPGPGMFAAKRDGTFQTAGQRFEPFFDIARNADAVVTLDAAAGRVELRDSNNVAFRYYRWEHGQPTGAQIGQILTDDDLNIPIILGNPEDNPALKGARYAILAAGPNGLFGNEDQLPASHPQALSIDQMANKLGMATPAPGDETRLRNRAMEDNIVEVGQ